MSASLPDRPILRRHLLTTVLGTEDVAVLAEDRTWLRRSPKLAALIPSLDGMSSLSDLLETPPAGLSAPEVILLLQQMHAAGWLVDFAGTEVEGCETEFGHAMGAVACDNGVRIREIAAEGASQDLSDAFHHAGINTSGKDEESHLDVVVTDHYFHGELDAMNADAVASGRPWMICKLVGLTLWIGPIFRPGHTACLTCLQSRLRLNRPVEDFVVRTTKDTRYHSPATGALPALTRVGAQWAALEAGLWLGGRSDRLEGKILSVGFGRTGLGLATHSVVRQQQCPVCGTPAPGITSSSTFFPSCAVPYSDNGARRTEHPEATWDRLKHHISPICGMVRWVSPSFDDPEGFVHVFEAGHHIAIGPETPKWLQRSTRCVASGKGISAAEARTGALCEAIERFCGNFREDVPRVRATSHELGAASIDLQACLNFSDRQYADRESINIANADNGAEIVPCRLSEHLEIDWVPLWSLSRQQQRYLPAAFCYYGHPDIGRHFYCAPETGGCAAGKVIEEAVLHGFLELVERDSCALWWYNQIQRPHLDLDSFDDPFLLRLRDYLRRRGRVFWALDITADLGIPTIAAVSQRVDGGLSEDLLLGLGADLDSAIALRRAVTEMIQFIPAVHDRGADGRTRYRWPDMTAVRFWTSQTVETQPQLSPSRALAMRRADFPNLSSLDLHNDLATCLRIAESNGLEVLVLDQSRPDVDLAVARVVVPGLRPFWRRLGPGRLYEVPLALRWRETPTPEETMNPVSIFF